VPGVGNSFWSQPANALSAIEEAAVFMTDPKIRAWWSTLLPEQRHEHLRVCGLSEDLASKSWSARSVVFGAI